MGGGVAARADQLDLRLALLAEREVRLRLRGAPQVREVRERHVLHHEERADAACRPVRDLGIEVGHDDAELIGRVAEGLSHARSLARAEQPALARYRRLSTPGRALRGLSACQDMSLRSLLGQLEHDPAGARLAREGGSAFVSRSLRPYLVAALLDGVDDALASGRPAVVVAGDDRQALELAADLRAWLAPRPVRFYPSRGVAYESHLAPPPHLVGLRVAGLDTLLDGAQDGEPAVLVVSAVALSEKVPDPALRPHAFWLRKGELLDLDEVSADLVAAGYERVEQVEDRGQFAIRGGILDVYPATEDHAVRVDLFDVEIESLRHFSTFTQRSLGDLEAVEIAPCAELAPEHRELAEIAAISGEEDRPDIAELLPVDRFHALLDLVPEGSEVLLAAEEEVAPALADHWQDVCAAFHDADAHHLYVAPDEIRATLDARARIRLSSLSSGQELEFRAQAADVGARSMKEAEPALEQHVRSGYRTVVAFARHGEGERAAYNLARLRAPWVEDDHAAAPQVSGEGSLRFAHAALREAFIAAGLAPRGDPRAPPLPAPPRRADRRAERLAAPARAPGLVHRAAHRRHRRARGPRPRALRRLRDEDRRRRHAGLPRARIRGNRQGLPAGRPAREDHALRRRRRHAPAASKLGGKSWEAMKARARRAAQELAGELLNLYAERRRRTGYAFPEDSAWQIEFEGRFPWQETADQAEAIEHVKADMERAQPMDRLICGDVGYGKTEVALRAAFKAANDGKQVLVRGADDDPRPAASRLVRRAPQGLPVRQSTSLPAASARPRSSARSSRPSMRARSTS